MRISQATQSTSLICSFIFLLILAYLLTYMGQNQREERQKREKEEQENDALAQHHRQTIQDNEYVAQRLQQILDSIGENSGADE